MLAAVAMALAAKPAVVGDGTALAYILALVAASIVIHELGHLLAARAVGFRILQFAIGPVRWSRAPDGSSRLRLVPSRLWGQCLVHPRHDAGLRRRLIAYFAGGSLLGLTVSALCVPAVLWLTPFTLPRKIAAVLLLVGLVVNLYGLVPMAGSSDGFSLRTLARGDARAAQFVAAFTAGMRNLAGISPRELSPQLKMALAGPAVDDSWAASGHLLLYYALLDEERFDEAGVALDQLEALSRAGRARAIARGLALLELAYFTAHHRRDPSAAREWLDAAGALPVRAGDEIAWRRAEGAVLIAEGRLGEARTRLDPIPALADRTDPFGRLATWQIRLRTAKELGAQVDS
jgi:hypothetical protein